MTLIQALLAQTFPTTPPADFITAHPTMASWIMGALTFIVVLQASATFAWIHREFAALKKTDSEMVAALSAEIAKATAMWERKSQERVDSVMAHIGRADLRVTRVEDRVGVLEKLLEVTKEHIGAGDAALTRIATAQERLTSLIERVQEENNEAHSQIITGRQDIIGRLSAVEAQSKMMVEAAPMMSGKELKALVATLGTLVNRLENGQT